MIDIGLDDNGHKFEPFELGRDNEQRLKEEVSRLYGAYHQSLGKLRIAMAFDRVETARHLLQETRIAWNEMRGHFMQVYENEMQMTEAARCQFARVKKLLGFAYPKSDQAGMKNGDAANAPAKSKMEEFYALYGFDSNEKMQFSSQLALALKWALKQNKIDIVKEIVPQLEVESNLFEFVYGKPFSVGQQDANEACKEDDKNFFGSNLYYLYNPHGTDNTHNHPMTHGKKRRNENGYLLELLNRRKQTYESWWHCTSGLRTETYYSYSLAKPRPTKKDNEQKGPAKDIYLEAQRQEDVYHESFADDSATKGTGDRGAVKKLANTLMADLWSLIKGEVFDLQKVASRDARSYTLCGKPDEDSAYEKLSQDKSDDEQDLIANQELMLWAALMNHYELAEYFWQKGGNAIPNALICSRLCQGVALTPVLSQPHFEEIQSSFTSMSERFEKLGVDVMSRCYAVDATKTQMVLMSELTAYDWLKYPAHKHPSCLKLAALARNRDFLSHAASQAVITKNWHGQKLTYDGKRKYKTWWAAHTCWFKGDASPQWKFRMDAGAYFILLVIYTNVALDPLAEEITVREWVLLGWFVSLMIDEFRQVVQEGWNYQSFREWWNMWNLMDFAMYIVFLIAILTRLFATGLIPNCRPDFEGILYGSDFYRRSGDECYEPDQNLMKIAKVIYGLNLIQVYVRSLQFLKIHQGFGVKIEVFKEIFLDFFQFLVLLFVFIFGYGIYIQTVHFPHLYTDGTSSTWNTFLRTVYRPYFQVYGELMLEDLAEESSCYGKTLPFTSCSNWTEYSVPIVTMVYLMITSIMIMNLMIAAFTDTYTKMYDVAVKVYRIGVYELLDDYEDRPVLPMPFGIHVSVLRLSRSVYQACQQCCGRESDAVSGCDESSLMSIEDRENVEKFQDIHADAFLEETRSTRIVSLSNQMSEMEAKLNTALDELEVSRGRAAATSAIKEKADESANANLKRIIGGMLREKKSADAVTENWSVQGNRLFATDYSESADADKPDEVEEDEGEPWFYDRKNSTTKAIFNGLGDYTDEEKKAFFTVAEIEADRPDKAPDDYKPWHRIGTKDQTLGQWKKAWRFICNPNKLGAEDIKTHVAEMEKRNRGDRHYAKWTPKHERKGSNGQLTLRKNTHSQANSLGSLHEKLLERKVADEWVEAVLKCDEVRERGRCFFCPPPPLHTTTHQWIAG